MRKARITLFMLQPRTEVNIDIEVVPTYKVLYIFLPYHTIRKHLIIFL